MKIGRIKNNVYEYLHIPIDNKILEKLKEEGAPKINSAWICDIKNL